MFFELFFHIKYVCAQCMFICLLFSMWFYLFRYTLRTVIQVNAIQLLCFENSFWKTMQVALKGRLQFGHILFWSCYEHVSLSLKVRFIEKLCYVKRSLKVFWILFRISQTLWLLARLTYLLVLFELAVSLFSSCFTV